jgi:hypothetical protein
MEGVEMQSTPARASNKLRKRPLDDRRLTDAIDGVYALPAILVAHKLGLFETIGRGALTTAEIALRLNLEARPTGALLACAASLGLINANGHRCRLTPLGAEYLLKESPTYWGHYLDFFIETRAAWSLDAIEKSLVSNVAQGGAAPEWVTEQTQRGDYAARFTRTMHSFGMAPALAWPGKSDLSRHSLLLDIGGGSGAHSIGATLKWKHLKAIVFDIPAVCEVAAEYANEYRLNDRIVTHRGDMWTDPFPAADVHFYSQIYHDWSPEKCRELTAKSFASLPPGGRIIVHEMLFNPAKTGPLGVAAKNMIMVALTQGQQFSANELREMLREAGFRSIQVKPTFGYWSIATGVKR